MMQVLNGSKYHYVFRNPRRTFCKYIFLEIIVDWKWKYKLEKKTAVFKRPYVG